MSLHHWRCSAWTFVFCLSVLLSSPPCVETGSRSKPRQHVTGSVVCWSCRWPTAVIETIWRWGHSTGCQYVKTLNYESWRTPFVTSLQSTEMWWVYGWRSLAVQAYSQPVSNSTTSSDLGLRLAQGHSHWRMPQYRMGSLKLLQKNTYFWTQIESWASYK